MILGISFFNTLYAAELGNLILGFQEKYPGSFIEVQYSSYSAGMGIHQHSAMCLARRR